MKKAQKVALKEKVVEAGILNFKVHSASPKRYERLFELMSMVAHVGVRGSEFGTIGRLRRLEDDFVFGAIYLFLNIDVNAAWYDAEKRVPVESDALGMETRIFSRLKPHLKEKLFVFDLRNHRLIFDSKGFHPATAQRFFERLCEEADVANQLGDIDIEIHWTEESIKQVLAIQPLTYLEIFITLPNPDDLTAAQETLFEELSAEGTLKYRETRRSVKAIGITPSARTIDLIQLSRTNGFTRASGFEEDQPVMRRTEEHPEIIREPYLPTEKALEAFLRIADSVYNRFTS